MQQENGKDTKPNYNSVDLSEVELVDVMPSDVSRVNYSRLQVACLLLRLPDDTRGEDNYVLPLFFFDTCPQISQTTVESIPEI